jgi:ABC-2 type transport system ATP-binding protein
VPAIVLDGIVKEYGEIRALDGVEFVVPDGAVLGLLGPNGSGKTTAVSILATLQRPTSGFARIGGFDVVKDAARVRELISLTGQYASLDESLTARENLTMFGRLTGLGRGAARDRIAEVARDFGLEEFVDRRIGTLSGGMRRRVDIACALVTRPQVLFLDEPTTGLDPRSRQAVWETVSTLRSQGITVLLTTQYLEEADRLADQIVMLDHGRIVAEGTSESLKQRAGGAVCEITLQTGDDLHRTRAALAGMDLVEDGAGGAANSHPRLTVAAPAGMATVADVIARLQHREIEVFDIGLRRQSLDEVFLRLTGATP